MNSQPTSVSAICEVALQETTALCRDVSQLSTAQAQNILQRYAAAIDGNFIPCMAAAMLSVQSIYARSATQNNLFEELSQDHPGMLKRFLASANIQPAPAAYVAVSHAVHEVHKHTTQMNGLKNMSLVTLCEYTSSAFIPYIAALAQKCGGTNFEYTDVHGVADIEHAKQCVYGLEMESRHYDNAENSILEMKAVLMRLWAAIYEVD
ncbi:MAG: iron-containing redox enzyme family protein [Candidatus Kerfeldbacteria bacterium]|nr:iron-containing redox enzyme family protein [Candidatus Kerfeldbacteria bacterium]